MEKRITKNIVHWERNSMELPFWKCTYNIYNRASNKVALQLFRTSQYQLSK